MVLTIKSLSVTLKLFHQKFQYKYNEINWWKFWNICRNNENFDGQQKLIVSRKLIFRVDGILNYHSLFSSHSWNLIWWVEGFTGSVAVIQDIPEVREEREKVLCLLRFVSVNIINLWNFLFTDLPEFTALNIPEIRNLPLTKPLIFLNCLDYHIPEMVIYR